jgi:Flp pilus assembly protein TadG
MTTLRRLCNDTEGAVLVEAALTTGFFILTIFSLIELGALFWAQVALQNGVEVAARCASLYNTSTCSTTSAVQGVAAANTLGLNPATSTFTVTLNTTCSGNPANRVTASYSFSLIGIYVLGAASMTLTAQSCYPSQPSAS